MNFRFTEKTDKGRGKREINKQTGDRERDDEIVSAGTRFAPEGRIVLRLSELCGVSGRSRSQQLANTPGRWRSISLISQTTNDNTDAKVADVAQNNKGKQSDDVMNLVS